MTNQAQADGLIGMHLPRTLDEIRAETACHLLRVLPDMSVAILFCGESTKKEVNIVELVIGEDCPLAIGSTVASNAWQNANLQYFPILYKGFKVGQLQVDGAVTLEQAERVDEILAHYAVAIVNIKLNNEALRSTDQYCASLQAFEKGVVLFQESSKEAVGARFLSLTSSVIGVQASALLILEEIGNTSSSLRIDQTMGIPDAMLEELRIADNSWWPPTLLDDSLQCFVRQEDGRFPPLVGVVPPALKSIAVLPLRYHGIVAGLYLAFNVDLDDLMMTERLSSARRLCELGAALFHRFGLEEAAGNERELKTQLQIAASIQQRLIPSVAPRCTMIDCSWQSKPAQYVGGDYLDLVNGEDGQVCSVIADVSGHGVDSALLMSSFRSNYRSDCKPMEPSDLLEKLNREVAHEVGDTGMFITAAAFKIDADGRGFSYASAGHNALYLLRAGSGEIVELESTGPSLGFLETSTFRSKTFEIGPGDILLLYTDGIVEATGHDSQLEMFGDDRLKACLLEHADKSSKGIMAELDRDLKNFTGCKQFEDDVSVSIIKIV